MIAIEHVTRRFGPILAVDDVSFTVGRGEVLGFLGPNGAGKSTTMRMVAGLLDPSGGSIRVDGFDVRTQSLDVRRRLGYLPEGAPLYPDMTPDGLLHFVSGVRGLAGSRRRAVIGDAVARLGLQPVMHRPVETLSRGFRRRVALALALLHDPDVLVLDEPTEGLDPNQKHDLRRHIQQIAHDKAIIVSTHVLEEVEALCTRVIIIAGGRLLVDAAPAALAAASPDGHLEKVFRRITTGAAEASA